jgi:hypothetical protein
MLRSESRRTMLKGTLPRPAERQAQCGGDDKEDLCPDRRRKLEHKIAPACAPALPRYGQMQGTRPANAAQISVAAFRFCTMIEATRATARSRRRSSEQVPQRREARYSDTGRTRKPTTMSDRQAGPAAVQYRGLSAAPHRARATGCSACSL